MLKAFLFCTKYVCSINTATLIYGDVVCSFLLGSFIIFLTKLRFGWFCHFGQPLRGEAIVLWKLEIWPLLVKFGLVLYSIWLPACPGGWQPWKYFRLLAEFTIILYFSPIFKSFIGSYLSVLCFISRSESILNPGPNSCDGFSQFAFARRQKWREIKTISNRTLIVLKPSSFG